MNLAPPKPGLPTVPAVKDQAQSKWNGSLITALMSQLTALATRANGCLPKDGSEPLSGITDGTAAAAGKVGEIISSTVVVGSAVALTSGVGANVTSIVLTPGDWEATGDVILTTNAATLTSLLSSISTSSATAQTGLNQLARVLNLSGAAATSTLAMALPVGPVTFNITSNTTIYLVTQAVFGAGTVGAYGGIKARRVR